MIKLWYEVVSTQWSTGRSTARTVTVSCPFRLETARTDAQNASIQYGNAGIFQMPGGHVIAEYAHGEVTYAEAGAGR